MFSRIFILEKKETKITDFINFWEKIYDNVNKNIKFRDNDYYWNNIGIKGENLIPLKQENIKPLFLWKNGKNLSKNKLNIVRKVQENIKKLNDFRKISEISWKHFDDFYNNVALECVKTTAPVFSLFIVHIAQPFKYPIIDQNVIRSFRYLSEGEKTEINPNNYLKIYKNFIEFFNEILILSKLSFRSVDKALWAFGRFLKNSGFNNLIF